MPRLSIDENGRAAGVRLRKPRRGRSLRLKNAIGSVLCFCRLCNTIPTMKTLTVRLPEDLIAQIEAESRRRRLSKSDVVRERLTETKRSRGNQSTLLDAVADVIGSVDE